MASFGRASMKNLSTCDPKLQVLFKEVVKHIDCSVLCGHRTKEEQDALQGFDPPWPNSKHNSYPSRGIDVAPYPIDWLDTQRFDRFAYFVLGMAVAKGIELRWGGDWDNDYDTDDNEFDDLPHFELVG